MRRIYFRAREKTSFAYRGLARRRALFVRRAKVAITEVDNREEIIALVGALTFIFGFGAGAILNVYLLAIGHPLVLHFRSMLFYKSAVFGDGILLPVINMLATAFILRNREFVKKQTFELALLLGIAVTVYFHVSQAVQGLVNWAMPAPWQWNILGVWHALYMFSVASLLSLFYLVAVKVIREEEDIPMQAILVTLGLVVFFMLLHLDYPSSSFTIG